VSNANDTNEPKGYEMCTELHKKLGQEWCKPSGYNESGGKPYCGFVAMRANCGWLLLCNVSQNMKTGEIVRVPIQVSEIYQL